MNREGVLWIDTNEKIFWDVRPGLLQLLLWSWRQIKNLKNEFYLKKIGTKAHVRQMLTTEETLRLECYQWRL